MSIELTSTQQKRFERARLSRDPRFDGKFFIGVKTTRIYCRPICRVKMPKAENCFFYHTAAAAAEAGYRPCLRCRPETSPGTPAWRGTSTTVNRALRLINEGTLDRCSIENLSDRLGVTPRHLSRLFSDHIGASPKSVAQTRRLHFAKKLINETTLSMTQISEAAGYLSVRRFNDHIKKVYKRSPSELRRDAGDVGEIDGFELRLGYREPLDLARVMSFLAVRAIPGVESVYNDRYERTIRINGVASRLSVAKATSTNGFGKNGSKLSGEAALLLRVDTQHAEQLLECSNKVRRLFDLDADPIEVNGVLCKDKALKDLVQQAPGQRLPGCWSPFEIAVRAIVGQQVSVKGATTVMGRIAEQYGEKTAYGTCFPEAADLRRLDIKTLSMPTKRAQAIKDLADAVYKGDISFDADQLPQDMLEQLVSIKGIGPWTAQYVAMRALNDPDAFLLGDLVLEKSASRVLGITSRKQLEQRAETWRPWRAYAGMHLWRAAADAS